MILATIGPETSSKKNIKKITQYTNFLRLNGSHANIKWHTKISKDIKDINNQTKILLDIPGVKPRTKNQNNILIKKNQLICFYYKKKILNNKKIIQIELTKPLPNYNKNIKEFSVSDGKFLFKLVRYGQKYIIGKSHQSFELPAKQGVNIPGSIYNEKIQERLYFDFLKKVKGISFNAIGLSFIQSENIIKKIKSKYPNFLIVSKIENSLGLLNYKKIIEESDVIMIDRGDLAAEIGDHKLFKAINSINLYCKKLGVPIIVATENLGSMMLRKTPSKSEVISLAYYLSLKVDRIMLSEETAISKNWENTLKWLKKFLEIERQKYFDNKSRFNIEDLLSKISGLPLILFTKKGYALKKIGELDNITKKFVFTDNDRIHSLCTISSKFKSFLIRKFDNTHLNNFIFNNLRNKKKIIFSSNNNAVLLYVNNPKKNSRANTIQFINKKDF